MSPPWLRRLALAVSVTGIALALTACAGQRVPGSASPNSASDNPSPTSSAPFTTTTTSSPEAPPATDGADLAACADGECEVRVTASAELPVPSSTTVEGLRVEAIAAEDVEFTGRTTGNRSSGSCSGRCRASSSNNTFKMTLGVGSTGRQNGLAITLVAIADGHAVVRLRPA